MSETADYVDPEVAHAMAEIFWSPVLKAISAGDGRMYLWLHSLRFDEWAEFFGQDPEALRAGILAYWEKPLPMKGDLPEPSKAMRPGIPRVSVPGWGSGEIALRTLERIEYEY